MNGLRHDMQAIFLALISMVCAAANDLVFKLYVRRGGSAGTYLAVIGVVWALVFAACLPSIIKEPLTFRKFAGVSLGIFCILLMGVKI